MTVRRRSLPFGWYPEDADTITRTVAEWTKPHRGRVAPGAAIVPGAPSSATAVAVVAPHAGWAFSGRLAAAAVAALAPASTIAVIGGHLDGAAPPLAAPEDGFETPLGTLVSDTELREALKGELSRRGMRLRDDEEADNTVEVQLPLVAAMHPGARVLWLRAPNGKTALALGEALRAAASSLGRSLACVGSTDLTHYGPNYGFSPAGRGTEAEAWVRQKNDKRFIDAVLALDGNLALELGERERSACSSGAAAAALAFALAAGAAKAELLEYATSLEVRRDSSFVGYAAIAFSLVG